ncbi:hypothetical protein HDU93_007149 [Gonapodya sp. JEL0774]|nr:hypothetical protein HDU93_007149 [Gonapodya sp. JEL0774]
MARLPACAFIATLLFLVACACVSAAPKSSLVDLPLGDRRIPSSHASSIGIPTDESHRVRFDGEKLVRLVIYPEPTIEQLSADARIQALADARAYRDGLVFYLEDALRLDVWGVQKMHSGAYAIDVRCSVDELAIVKDSLKIDRDERVKLLVVSENIQEAIEGERIRLFGEEQMREMKKKPLPGPAPKPSPSPNSWFKEYHSYPDIITFFSSLAAANPSIATFTPSIGKTYEGRDLAAFTICSVPAEVRDAVGVKQVWWQGMIHAREWIAGATVQYLAHRLVTAYGDAADVDHEWAVSVLNQTEFTIIPAVNPDGYDYAWNKNRLWRKNRRPVKGTYGVDLNRCGSDFGA